MAHARAHIHTGTHTHTRTHIVARTARTWPRASDEKWNGCVTRDQDTSTCIPQGGAHLWHGRVRRATPRECPHLHQHTLSCARHEQTDQMGAQKHIKKHTHKHKHTNTHTAMPRSARAHTANASSARWRFSASSRFASSFSSRYRPSPRTCTIARQWWARSPCHTSAGHIVIQGSHSSHACTRQ